MGCSNRQVWKGGYAVLRPSSTCDCCLPSKPNMWHRCICTVGSGGSWGQDVSKSKLALCEVAIRKPYGSSTSSELSGHWLGSFPFPVLQAGCPDSSSSAKLRISPGSYHKATGIYLLICSLEIAHCNFKLRPSSQAPHHKPNRFTLLLPACCSKPWCRC